MATSLDNGLPRVNRVITDHTSDASPPKAVFSAAVADELEWEQLAEGARFSLAYATSGSPVALNNGADLETYQHFLANKPGVMIPGGTVLRYVDMPPGALSPMHRTISLDFGIVVEGEVALVLDSGEEKLLRRGDVTVQRGTNHAWRNNSTTAWARMLYVLQDAQPVVIAGKVLGEDYGNGLTELPPSKR